MKKIPIVFATNENYAPYAGVTITSIIENSSKEYFYDIYVFYTDLSSDTISRFHQMNGENFSVTCKDVNSYIDRELLYENFHFSKEMYYRILIPTILSQYKKVIYLDCDMVVLGDISELYQTDLKGYVLAGVNDVQHYDSKNYVSEVLNLDTSHYINSGMLVINCDEFNKQDIKNKCFKALAETNIKLRYPDQDIINITCHNKIKFLDQSWNYIWHYNFPRINKPNLLLSKEDQEKYDKFANNINILHYTSNIKPWNNYNSYLSAPFFEYARKTQPFKEIIFTRFNAINMKNYIVLQAVDRVKDDLIVTGAFYSIEDYLYNNSLYLNYNKKTHKIKYIFSRNIDLRNNCYTQRFFRFKIDLKTIKNEEITFSFFRKEYPTKRLPVLTGKWFPIDMNTKSKTFFDNYQMFIDCKQLKIKKASEKDKIDFEKAYRKTLKQSNNSAHKKSLWVRRIYSFTKPIFRKKIWLITDRPNSAGDNGEAMFKWLSIHKQKNVKPYFVIEKKSPDYKRMRKYGKVVCPKSFKFKLLFLHTDKIISSQLPREIIEPYNTTFLKDLFFNKQTVFLQHGITKDNISSAYSRCNQGINLFICAAKEEQKSILSIPEYGFINSNVALTGFPRFDYLENKSEKIIYITPTWRKNLQKDINSNNLKNLKQSEFYKFYTNFLNSTDFILLIEKLNYKVKFVPHPLARTMFSDFKPQHKNIEIITENISYNEMFKNGSIFITDYSSAAFDFAYLKKPLIYCQFDKETFYDSHTYTQGYFDYERDAFGKVTYNLKDTLKELHTLLANNCKMPDKYVARVDKFFCFNDQNNCERVLKEIIKNDKEILPLLKRVKLCYKEHGLKYTIKRIFVKIFRG